MVKIEPLQLQPPSKFEFLEYLKFEYLEYKNGHWPTLLAEYDYAPTLAGLETLLVESYVSTTQNATCIMLEDKDFRGEHIIFCFQSTLAELKLLAEYGYKPTFADLEISPDFLEWYERFQSGKLRKNMFEEYFNGDWRPGREVHKVVITQRLYQTSPNSTQE